MILKSFTRKNLKSTILIITIISLIVLCCATLALAAGGTGGGGGTSPLNYLGTFLTSISGNISTTGGQVDNSTSVPVKPLLKVRFDLNVVNDSVWAANAGCFSLLDSQGNSLPIDVTRISDIDNFDERENVFVQPQGDLTQGNTYRLKVSPTLKGKNGITLAGTTNGEGLTITFAVASSSSPAAQSGGGGGGESTGTVTGRVIDISGNPVTATITGYGSTVQTNADGSFSIAAPAGNVEFKYDASGYQSQAQWLQINAGQTTQAPTCILTPLGIQAVQGNLGEIFGRVVNTQGQPIPGTAVRVDITVIPTNPGGQFRFTLVYAGVYTVYYDAPGYVGQTQVIEVGQGEMHACPTVILNKV